RRDLRPESELGIGERSVASSADYACDPRSRFAWILVRPHADRKPAGFCEACIRILVSPPIALDLFAPPLGVGSRPCSMLRAPVPEAAVDEDSDSCRSEDDVGTPPQTRHGASLDAKAKPEAVQRRPEGDFSWCVALSRCLHPATD